MRSVIKYLSFSYLVLLATALQGAVAGEVIEDFSAEVSILEVNGASILRSDKNDFLGRMLLSIPVVMEGNLCMIEDPSFSTGFRRASAETILSVFATGNLLERFFDVDGCAALSRRVAVELRVGVSLPKWEKSVLISIPYQYGNKVELSITRNAEGEPTVSMSKQ